jgi:hypothetical protein
VEITQQRKESVHVASWLTDDVVVAFGEQPRIVVWSSVGRG